MLSVTAVNSRFIGLVPVVILRAAQFVLYSEGNANKIAESGEAHDWWRSRLTLVLDLGMLVCVVFSA